MATFTGTSGNDTITGAGNDTLNGGIGNDTLVGGDGSGQMAGGAGNDTYTLGAGDSVTDLAGEGTDVVLSAVTSTLGANVENLILTEAVAATTCSSSVTVPPSTPLPTSTSALPAAMRRSTSAPTFPAPV